MEGHIAQMNAAAHTTVQQSRWGVCLRRLLNKILLCAGKGKRRSKMSSFLPRESAWLGRFPQSSSLPGSSCSPLLRLFLFPPHKIFKMSVFVKETLPYCAFLLNCVYGYIKMLFFSFLNWKILNFFFWQTVETRTLCIFLTIVKGNTFHIEK